MDILESLRYEMRRRIVTVAGIVSREQYQREWKNEPENETMYIRETVMEYTREEDSQVSELITALCEYDVFLKKKSFINPMATASDIASRLIEEFNVKNPEKVGVTLDGWTGGVSASVARYNYGSPSQEEELFRFPVLIYVEIRFPSSAKYEG